MEQEWDNGLCDHVCGASDFKSCVSIPVEDPSRANLTAIQMGAWCCNCFMFGRVAQRLEKFPSTNKDNMPLFNGMCGLMCLADYVHLCKPNPACIGEHQPLLTAMPHSLGARLDEAHRAAAPIQHQG